MEKRMSIRVCLMSHLVCKAALRFLSNFACYGFDVMGDAEDFAQRQRKTSMPGSGNWCARVLKIEVFEALDFLCRLSTSVFFFSLQRFRVS